MKWLASRFAVQAKDSMKKTFQGVVVGLLDGMEKGAMEMNDLYSSLDKEKQNLASPFQDALEKERSEKEKDGTTGYSR